MKTQQNFNQDSLARLAVGQTAQVSGISGNNAVTRRMMEMGVVPGVRVKVIKNAPFGCPMEIRLRGYNLALRRSEAESILVKSD